MKNFIALTLLIVFGVFSTYAQGYYKSDCSKELEAKLKKERVSYNLIDRASYLDPRNDSRRWVLLENGDTIFYSNSEEDKKKYGKHFDSSREEGRYINLKSANNGKCYVVTGIDGVDMDTHFGPECGPTEYFLFTDELIKKYKLPAAYSRVKKVAFSYISENSKVKVYWGAFALGASIYIIVTAIDKQTADIVELLELSNVKGFENRDKMIKNFYHKHLSVDCEEYKYAYNAYLPFKNKVLDTIQLRFLLYINAQRKCEGLPNNFELVDCYYKQLYNK